MAFRVLENIKNILDPNTSNIEDPEFGKYQIDSKKKRNSPKPTEKRAGKYNSGTREPLPFPGYTILAEPYPLNLNININIQQELINIQNKLEKQVNGFVPVPPETFHLTIADLI